MGKNTLRMEFDDTWTSVKIHLRLLQVMLHALCSAHRDPQKIRYAPLADRQPVRSHVLPVIQVSLLAVLVPLRPT